MTGSGVRRRAPYAAAAVGLALAAAVLPTRWYDTLPHQPNLPLPPVSGVALLRLLLLVEALVLGAVAAFGWRFRRLPPESRYGGSGDWDEPGDLAPRVAGWALAAVTVLALALRLFHAGADLWIDEISPIVDYGAMPVAQVLGSYLRSNNHLLNTLLLKLAIATFGEREWAVRLPAILFGVAAVPALYWCARLALSRRASVGAALLLAVSYHHVFFSQNARGYSAYLLFALLAARLLVNGLREDRPAVWGAYVAAVVLGFASLLNTGFVLAAHALVGLGALWAVRRRGAAPGPLARRLAAVFAVAAVASAQLYVVALPEAYVVITHVYKSQGTGFALFSREFAREIARGVAAGFGPGVVIAAVPFLLVAGAGFLALGRRRWPLALALALPGALTAAFLLARGLTFSPRFFLLWLPLAILTAVVAVDAGTGWLLRATPSRARAAATTAVFVLALLSAASLRRYYAVPKQPYRAALAAVERWRGPEDLVVVVYAAEPGVRYYGARLGVPLDTRYRFVRSVPALDSALAARGRGRVVLVVTFERALRVGLPALYERLVAGWTATARFPGTVGDGGIALWEERGPTPHTPGAGAPVTASREAP